MKARRSLLSLESTLKHPNFCVCLLERLHLFSFGRRAQQPWLGLSGLMAWCSVPELEALEGQKL